MWKQWTEFFKDFVYLLVYPYFGWEEREISMSGEHKDEVKQVIVMRRKYPDGKGGTVGLRRGKEIAQACHASNAFLLQDLEKMLECDSRMPRLQQLFEMSMSPAVKKWLNEGIRKVVLQVDTEEELMTIADICYEEKLECHVITDSGLTEFGGVPTKTCLAIGPDFSSRIDRVTGNLKIY